MSGIDWDLLNSVGGALALGVGLLGSGFAAGWAVHSWLHWRKVDNLESRIANLESENEVQQRKIDEGVDINLTVTGINKPPENDHQVTLLAWYYALDERSVGDRKLAELARQSQLATWTVPSPTAIFK